MDDPKKNPVTIERGEYKRLIHDRMFLRALLGSGVSSWDGYKAVSDIVEYITEDDIIEGMIDNGEPK